MTDFCCKVFDIAREINVPWNTFFFVSFQNHIQLSTHKSLITKLVSWSTTLKITFADESGRSVARTNLWKSASVAEKTCLTWNCGKMINSWHRDSKYIEERPWRTQNRIRKFDRRMCTAVILPDMWNQSQTTQYHCLSAMV